MDEFQDKSMSERRRRLFLMREHVNGILEKAATEINSLSSDPDMDPRTLMKAQEIVRKQIQE